VASTGKHNAAISDHSESSRRGRDALTFGARPEMARPIEFALAQAEHRAQSSALACSIDLTPGVPLDAHRSKARQGMELSMS
jgi:hypothetical protein